MITDLLDNAKHKCLSRSVLSFSQALTFLFDSLESRDLLGF